MGNVANNKHQNNIEKSIDDTNYKYDPDSRSQTEKVFHNPLTKQTDISHTGTHFGSKNWYNEK